MADTTLGGYLLPGGTNIAYSSYVLHHLPDYYDAPETFDPDRWEPQRPQPPRHAVMPIALQGVRRIRVGGFPACVQYG